VVDSAFVVHKALGPGLLEGAYGACLTHELTKRGLSVATQVVVPIVHDGLTIDQGFRADMVVSDCVLVELKCVEAVLPVHEAQVLTYLRLSGLRLGFLINFHAPLLKLGIKRFRA